MRVGRRAGRPGLLGAVGRTAVVAGTAQMTVNAVNRHAQQRSAQAQEAAPQAQQAPPPPPPPPPPPANRAPDDMVGQLTKLAELHQAGALSDEEFTAAKKELLGR